MPGIAGIIGKGRSEKNRIALEAMLRPMMHEQFYRSGTYVDERLGLWAGWTCQPGSFADCLPIWNEKKDVCLIFSGEEFSAASEVESPGYLLGLYEREGIDFLKRLNGWFRGVLVDLRENKIILFNDRYGLGRVYLHETDEAIFFSSEAKSLISILPGVRQLDPASVAEFLTCGCALQNRTLFAGVSLLACASKWTFVLGRRAIKETYFQKELWEHQTSLDAETYYSKFRETFARILPRYIRGQPGIGMSLTGGLDGRMIMAWSGAQPGTLPCYTFGGAFRDCADVKAARKVAETCGQPHQVIRVDGEFVGQFPRLAERAVYISDGTMDVAGSVELYVNAIAREIAPVRLTGNYGSEILRRGVAFKPRSLLEDLYDEEMVQRGRSAAETYAAEAEGNRLSFVAFKQVPWHHHSRFALELSQLTPRSPYLDNELVALAYQAPSHLAASPEPSLRLIADGNTALSRIPTDRGVLHRPVPVLTRARNLHGELTAKAEYAYDSGMPQWLAGLDHAVAPLHLERLFLGHHKFYHFRIWYRDKLAGYIKEVLLDSRARNRPYLRGAFLEEMVKGHLRGNRNYTVEIHKVLSLELIQQQLLERNWN